MNFIQQAYKGKNDWYLYLLTFFFVFIGWQIIGAIPLLLVAYYASDDLGEIIRASQNGFLDLGIDSNLFLFVMIVTFAVGLLCLLFAVKKFHHRSITSLVTSRKKIDWNRFFYGFLLWFSIVVVLLAIDYSMNSENYVWNFKPIPFLVLVLISIVFMPLQTSFEELLFRGYFMQGLGFLFKNAAIPLIVTSVGFGLLHGFNPEVQKLGYIVMVYYIGTGFFWGITTLMDGGTELSLGMHAANNIVAAVFVTMDWAVFQTDALFIDISEPSVNMELFLPVFLIYPTVLFIFSKKYGWTNWKEKLFGEVAEPVKEFFNKLED
jgi:membrane protease YdiL (CAAX protease family)